MVCNEEKIERCRILISRLENEKSKDERTICRARHQINKLEQIVDNYNNNKSSLRKRDLITRTYDEVKLLMSGIDREGKTRFSGKIKDEFAGYEDIINNQTAKHLKIVLLNEIFKNVAILIDTIKYELGGEFVSVDYYADAIEEHLQYISELEYEQENESGSVESSNDNNDSSYESGEEEQE